MTNKRGTTEERRAQIVDALMEVMAETGYAKATIGKIAAKAGLTSGLVHYHFGSKLEILESLIEFLVEQYLESLDLERESTATAKLRKWLQTTLSPDTGNRPDAVRSWVVICAEAIREPALAESFRAALDRIAGPLHKVIEEGNKSGEFQLKRKEIPSKVAAILSLVHGYFLIAATARTLIPYGSAVEESFTMALAILGDG